VLKVKTLTHIPSPMNGISLVSPRKQSQVSRKGKSSASKGDPRLKGRLLEIFPRVTRLGGDAAESLGVRGSFEGSQLLLRCGSGSGFPGEFCESEHGLELDPQKPSFAGTLRNLL
jgi:hypothetical protein